MRFLTAIPIFNEEKHLEEVLRATRPWSPEILVVDDGSTDCTPCLLRRHPDVRVITHETNQGYGAGLRDSFRYAIEHNYDIIVTMDCDGQHEPSLIGDFVRAAADTDIVSGSRYVTQSASDSLPPPDRYRINMLITQELNERFGLALTDAFCGFKAYRVESLKKLHITEPGYGMPLELWVQAAHHGLRVRELAVPLIYLEEKRAFGGSLDNPEQRLAYYRNVMNRAVSALPIA